MVVDSAGHEPAGRLGGRAGPLGPHAVGTLLDDKEQVLASGLERHEERTIDAFRSVMHHRDNMADEEMLRAIWARSRTKPRRLRSLDAAT
jgi:hypothetical protein